MNILNLSERQEDLKFIYKSIPSPNDSRFAYFFKQIFFNLYNFRPVLSFLSHIHQPPLCNKTDYAI